LTILTCIKYNLKEKMDGACIRVEEARAFRVVHKGSYDGQTLPSTKVLKVVY